MKGQSDAFDVRGQLTVKTLKDGKVLREIGPFKNKVVSSTGYGRNLILEWMAGTTTYPIVIDSAAIGDGSVAAADGDTALGNSLLASIPLTTISVSNNVLTIDVFIADATLPNDTYSEFGFFANGRLISRVLISPAYTKAAGEDSLFTYTLTMTG